MRVVDWDLWANYGEPGEIIVAEGLQPSEVARALVQGGPISIIQTNSDQRELDILNCKKIHSNHGFYFKNPVAAVFGEEHKYHEYCYSGRSEKEAVRDWLLKLVSSNPQSNRLAVETVFEELFMNSTIDAPRLSTNKASDEIEKFRPKSRLIFSEARGRTLLVCEDSYGSLKIEKFIKRLDEVYLLGAGKAINLTREKGGAGLGCMIIFENCSALYLGVLEGIMTTITVEIPTKLNAKQRELVGKSVHLVRK